MTQTEALQEARRLSEPVRADARGPVRRVVSIEETSAATFLTLACGHRGSHAQHFIYRVGETSRWYRCWEAAFADADRKEATQC